MTLEHRVLALKDEVADLRRKLNATNMLTATDLTAADFKNMLIEKSTRFSKENRIPYISTTDEELIHLPAQTRQNLRHQ